MDRHAETRSSHTGKKKAVWKFRPGSGSSAKYKTNVRQSLPVWRILPLTVLMTVILIKIHDMAKQYKSGLLMLKA